MKNLVFILFLLASAGAGAEAADSPFNGTWRLNPLKSHFTGDTFTYSATDTGLMHYSDGSTTEYDFGLDGKPYPVRGGYTVTWTQSGENTWISERRLGDKVLVRTRRTLSPDGKTLTNEFTEFRPDGSEAQETDIYARVSGGPGLAGKWKNVKVQTSSDRFTMAIPAPGQIRFENLAYRMTVAGPADGRDIPYEGPTVPKGFTVAFTAKGPLDFKYVDKFEGKPLNVGTMKVSADGTTLTQVFWTPGKEDEKATAVYEKQKTLHGQASPAVEQELLKVEEAWSSAVLKGDTAALQRIYADEYTGIDSEGRVLDRFQDIGQVASGDLKAESSRLDGLKVRAYGSVAIVTGRTTTKAMFRGKDVSGQYRFTDVFVKRDGRWQCVSTQSALIPKP